MARVRGDYSGRSQYELILDASVHSYSGSSVRYNYHLFAHSKQGWGSFSNDARPWALQVGGWSTSDSGGLPFAPGDYTGKTITLASGVTGWMSLSSGGQTLYAWHENNGVIGSAYTNTGTAPHVPPAPTPTSSSNPDQITHNSMRYRFSSAGHGGSSIIRWEIQYSKNSNFSGGTVITSTGTSTISGLDPDTTYYFRARGVNGMGTGPWSSSRSGKTAASVPSAPTNPSAELVGALIEVTWDPPTSDGGSPVTGYEVQYADNAGFADPSTPVSATSPKAFSLGLGEWFFRVRALNANGSGAWSSVVSDTVVRRGFPKFFDGEGWVVKPVKVYLDGEWVQKPIKAYTGSEWVTPE